MIDATEQSHLDAIVDALLVVVALGAETNGRESEIGGKPVVQAGSGAANFQFLIQYRLLL